MAPEYHFITNWHLRATAQEVSSVLEDPLGLPRWWPSVYLDVKEIEPGARRGEPGPGASAPSRHERGGPPGRPGPSPSHVRKTR